MYSIQFSQSLPHTSGVLTIRESERRTETHQRILQNLADSLSLWGIKFQLTWTAVVPDQNDTPELENTQQISA